MFLAVVVSHIPPKPQRWAGGGGFWDTYGQNVTISPSVRFEPLPKNRRPRGAWRAEATGVRYARVGEVATGVRHRMRLRRRQTAHIGHGCAEASLGTLPEPNSAPGMRPLADRAAWNGRRRQRMSAATFIQNPHTPAALLRRSHS